MLSMLGHVTCALLVVLIAIGISQQPAFGIVISATPPGCVCPQFTSPVCGSDGRVYANACAAECAQVEYRFYSGSCRRRVCQVLIAKNPSVSSSAILNLEEVKLFDQYGVQIPRSDLQFITSSQYSDSRGTYPSSNCNDGVTGNGFTNNMCHTALDDKFPSLSVTYPCTIPLGRVDVYNRKDDGQERIWDFEMRFVNGESADTLPVFPFNGLKAVYRFSPGAVTQAASTSVPMPMPVPVSRPVVEVTQAAEAPVDPCGCSGEVQRTVCGFDGRTYASPCQARCMGSGAAYRSACAPAGTEIRCPREDFRIACLLDPCSLPNTCDSRDDLVCLPYYCSINAVYRGVRVTPCTAVYVRKINGLPTGDACLPREVATSSSVSFSSAVGSSSSGGASSGSSTSDGSGR